MKNTTKTPKVPKTVKVSTLVKAFAIALALVASFITGWHSNQNYQFTVHEDAASLVSQLKSKQ